MKPSFFAAGLIVGLGLMANLAWSRPVDLSAPSGELGAANSKGYLEIWREIDDVGLQLGKDSFLPLRYKFSSDAETGGLLGPGFYLPMFEAKNVLIRENTMRAYLPCGKGLYFWRDTVDPNKFTTVDKEWSGYQTGDDFVVWRDDGWKLVYHKNRLTSITSDDNHVFTWDYTNGMPTEIDQDGKALVTVEPNAAGQIAALVFQGKRFELSYDKRPVVQTLNGMPAIKEIDQVLANFKYPDGKSDTFKFGTTSELVPTLATTNHDGEQAAYTWDVGTGHIVAEQAAEGTWTYTVGQVAEEFGLPSLSRVRSDGKSESMAVDTQMGTYTAKGINGVTTVTHIFETPGPLYHKVQKVEQIIDGKTTTTYRASYDEMGRLTREANNTIYIKNYTYNSITGEVKKFFSLSTDPNTLMQLSQEEKSMLDHIDKLKALAESQKQLAISQGIIANTQNVIDASSRQDAFTKAQKNLVDYQNTLSNFQDALEKLAFFYIHRMGNSSKALALITQMTSGKQIFNVKLHSIDGNMTISNAQKADELAILVKEYPEQKHLLDMMIEARRNN